MPSAPCVACGGVMDVALSQPHRAMARQGAAAATNWQRAPLAAYCSPARSRSPSIGPATAGESSSAGVPRQCLPRQSCPVRPWGRWWPMKSTATAAIVRRGRGRRRSARTDEERRERVLVQHSAAMNAIRRLSDKRQVFAVMESVVLRDAEIDFALLQVPKAGLGQLARLWRMERPHDPMEEKHGPKPRVLARGGRIGH